MPLPKQENVDVDIGGFEDDDKSDLDPAPTQSMPKKPASDKSGGSIDVFAGPLNKSSVPTKAGSDLSGMGSDLGVQQENTRSIPRK